MSLSQRILNRVEKFFSKQGFQLSDYDEEFDNMVLSDGKENILVKIIFEDDAERNAIYEALASLAKKTLEYNRVYVAAPRGLCENVETALFMKNGVGLIVYDDYSADEKVPAIPSRKTIIKQDQEATGVQSVEKGLRRVESLIRELSERVDSLEKAYFSILREVRELRLLLEKKVMVVEKPAEKPPSRIEEKVEPSGLPSFLRDNPWVEILSKRSEENF